MEIEPPVTRRDGASFACHARLTGMLRTALRGDQMVQMGQPSKKRLLAPFGMMEAFPRDQRPLDGVVGLISQGTRQRHLRVGEDRRPPRLLVLEPVSHALAGGRPRCGGDVVGQVA